MTTDLIKLISKLGDAAGRSSHERDHEAIIEAAAALRRLSERTDAGWQPIDTAPKDGTHILACHIPIGIRVTINTHPPTVVHWFDDPDEPGFYTSVNELAPEHQFNPTHWQPLDPLPLAARPKQPRAPYLAPSSMEGKS